MKNQLEFDFEQQRRQIGQWADRQNRYQKISTIRRYAKAIAGSIVYLLLTSLILVALLRLVGRV